MWRRGPSTPGQRKFLGGFLLLVAVVRLMLLVSHWSWDRQRAEDTARGQRMIDDWLNNPPTPRPAPTTVPPAPGAAADGWTVDELDVRCEGGVWTGQAIVHATTRSFDRLAFDFTLYDGKKKLVGHLQGRHDGTAIMEPGPIDLTSSDPCRATTPRSYRYDVT